MTKKTDDAAEQRREDTQDRADQRREDLAQDARDSAGEDRAEARASSDVTSASAGRPSIGSIVQVLDWSRDANAPTQSEGVVKKVNDDGTVDVDVNLPGVAQYEQQTLVECTAGDLKPGQWQWPTLVGVVAASPVVTPAPGQTQSQTPHPLAPRA